MLHQCYTSVVPGVTSMLHWCNTFNDTFISNFNDKFNPKNNFAAIMTCSSAEKNCPFISGSDKIISIPYDDPKKFDDSRYVYQEYMNTNLIIATEMYYVFSSLKV